MKSRDPFAESGPKEITVTRNHPARLRALSVLMLALAIASPALAEEAAEEESRFSGALQVDFTNAYFFRGILQEREGTSVPALDGALLQPVLLGGRSDPRRHGRRGHLEQLPERADVYGHGHRGTNNPTTARSGCTRPISIR